MSVILDAQNRIRRRAGRERIIECEYSLGRKLSPGERRDLLKDNFPWDSKLCDEIANEYSNDYPI